MHTRRHFAIGATALLGLLAIGTAGYSIIEGWGLAESLYMTIITLSTVGYSEVAPLSNSGRLFTSVLILVGLGAVFYTVTAAFGYLVEEGFRGTLWRRRMIRDISRLKEHFIVCGYGRVGEEVAAIVRSTGAPVVVIDSDPVAIERAKQADLLCVQGNASTDAVLQQAGIQKARGLIAAASSDAENVFITLSAKHMNPDVFLVARGCSGDAAPKLESAGANKVVLPLRIGGKHMAMMAMRPLLVSFIDTYLGRPSNPIEVEGIEVVEDSPAAGRTVANIEGELGLTVLALRKADQRLFPKPEGSLMVAAGDQLIVLGARKQLEQVEAEVEQHPGSD